MIGLLAGMNLDELRAKARRDPVRGLYERVERTFRRATAELRSKGDVFSVANCASMTVTAQEIEAGLIHALSGDGEALEHVHRMIDVLERTWTSPPSWHVRAGGHTTSYFSHAYVCLAARMCDQSLDRRRRDTLLRLVREALIDDDGFELVFRFGGGHNIALTRYVAAAICALTWGEEANHPRWRAYVQFGRDACAQYCHWALDEAGVNYEGVGYGYGPAVYWLYLFADLLHRNGGENLFQTLPVLGRIPDAVRHLVFPDASGMAQISDLFVPDTLPWLCLTGRVYNRPQDLALWRAYRAGLTGRISQGCALEVWHSFRGWMLPILWLDDAISPPPLEESALPTALCAHGTETVALRTSWSREAVWVNILGQGRSLGSLGHMHADAGHFSLFAHGEYLAIDTGYWNDLEDQHNVVLVDGKVSRHDRVPAQTAHRAGRIMAFDRHDILDYVSVDQSAVKDCRWAHRHFLFVRLGGDDAYLVILDNINPDDRGHEFWWQLHAHPASVVEVTGPSTATIHREHTRLDCTFVMPSPNDFPSDPHRLRLHVDEAWCPTVQEADRPRVREQARALRGNDLDISSLWRPRLLAQLTGLNGMMMSVLVPRRADEQALRVESVQRERALEVRVHSGRFVDTIVSALGRGDLRLEDFPVTTELAVIRRDHGGRVTDRMAVR